VDALLDLANRLGWRPPPRRRTADGRPHPIFLIVSGLASLALWAAVGWGLWRLVAGLGQG